MDRRKLRKELEAALQARVPEARWRVLADAGYLEDVEVGAADTDYLVGKYREIFGRVSAPKRGREVKEDLVRLREDAISRLVGGQVANDRDVQDFRSQVLGGRLLKDQEIDGWTRLQDSEILVHLERLSAALEDRYRRYGWQKGPTMLFLLTGWPPQISGLQVTRHIGIPNPPSPHMVLVVDPALSPRTVADFYRAERQKLLGKRYRALTRKLTVIATFLAPWPPSGPWGDWLSENWPKAKWADKMAVWNKLYPQWQYKHESNFSRAFYQAKRRLLLLPLDTKS